MNREHEPVLPADRHQLLRGHLMSEISRENVVARKRPVRRYGWAALPALAGGLALTVVLNTGGGAAPAVAATASQVLDRAAQVAVAKSLPKPDGKYVYVKSLVAFDGQNLSTGQVTRSTPHLRESWMSVDGRKPGLIKDETWKAPGTTKPGDPYAPNPDGSQPTQPNTTPSVNSPTYQFLAELPTDPDVLLGRLYVPVTGDKVMPVDQQAFDTVGDLVGEQIAPPAVTAALYRAAAKIPGVELLEDSVDASGRHGWGVARTDGAGVRRELVFDRESYEFLGERLVTVKAGDFGQPGTVIGQSAVLSRALVDKVGEQ
jgi:hypothetical protein